jgi:hypothetical protein
MNVRHSILAAAVLVAACAPTADTPFAPEEAAPPQFGPPPVGNNAPPSVTITAPSDGAVITIGPGGAVVNVTADFTDLDAADTHTCSIDWQLALTMGTVTESGGAGTCTGSFTFAVAGSYAIGVSVIDNLGGTGSDGVDITVSPTGSAPPAGRLHGEGGIHAVRGTYPARTRLAGKIDFGFSVRTVGADRRKSSVRVNLKGLGRMLKADGLTSFSVAGAEAELRGIGRIDGRGRYPFLISVVDGDQPGGDGIDRIRIVIWADGGILVDTEPQAADPAAAATMPLSYGRIVFAP